MFWIRFLGEVNEIIEGEQNGGKDWNTASMTERLSKWERHPNRP